MMVIHSGVLTVLLIILACLVYMEMGFQSVLSDDLNPGLYSPNSNPYGTSFAKWTEKWWQWFIQIPTENIVHPLDDRDGKSCGINQEGPVWYLPGANGEVTRSCTIPAGKAILFPVLNAEFSELEEHTPSEKDLRNKAISENNVPEPQLLATIDGYEIKDIKENYRVTSGLFNVTFPKNNVFGVELENDTRTIAVSDGWFIMLEPLKPGLHHLYFNGQQVSQASFMQPGADNKNTVIKVNYSLTIE